MKQGIFFILLLLMSICLSCDTTLYDLKYNLNEGETYSQVIIYKIDLSQHGKGQDINMKSDMMTESTYKVVEVDKEGNYLLEIRFTQFEYKINTPYGNIEMDSRNPGSDLYSYVLSELMKESFQMTMSEKGEILNIQGLDNYFERVLNGIEDLDPAEKMTVKKMLEGAYDKNTFKSTLALTSSMFPENKVKKGDRWENTVVFDKGVKANLENKWKLEKAGKEFYFISGKASAEAIETDATYGQVMNYNIEGDQDSEFKIDKNTGWIIEASISQSFYGSISAKPSEQIPEGGEWPIRFKSEIEIQGF